MRDLKCKMGTGNVVAAVVAVLEKQSNVDAGSRIYVEERGNFREQASSGNRFVDRCESATQSLAKNSGRSLENSIFSLEDESFRTAVEDFDSVAEDVRRNFVKTDSLRRRREAGDGQSGEVYGAYRIERTHSLKSIRTNPYVPSQDYTRSLGRREIRKIDSTTYPPAQPFSNSWTPNPIPPGHGSRLHPMPARPEHRNTSPKARDLTSQELLDGGTNIERDEAESGSYHLRQHEDADYKRLSGTDSSTTDGLTSGSSSSGDSSDSDDDSVTERAHVMVKGLETITEEDRITPSSLRSSRKDAEENESSSSEDATAAKNRTLGWSEDASTAGSTSDLSSSVSLEGRKSSRDSSTRCNSDFQWIAKEDPTNDLNLPKMDVQTPPSPTSTKPPINRNSPREKPQRKEKAPGSLDRRRPSHSRQERDQKSRSTHLKSPSRSEEFQPCPSWCCSPTETYGFDHFHRRHERNDPHKYGSNPMLVEQRGSHPDIYGDMNRCRHEMVGCCSYHMAPPPCYFYGDRGYRWTPPSYAKPGEQDEKLRKLQFEKDNLHLQVQVLTDQIEAQSYKISDLEKTLQDKKHSLVEAEEKLQREMLSRSSLETQKLELMSIISDLKLQQAAVERENMELRNNLHMNNNGDLKKSSLLPRNSPQPHAAVTPIQHSSQGNTLRVSPSPSPITSMNSTRRLDTNQSLQDIQPPKTPPSSYKRQIDIHYASLPRQQFLSNGGSISSVDFNANPSLNGGKKAVVFAQTERGSGEENNGDASQLQIGKSKGIKKIFGKIKRSGSGNLEDLPGVGEFQRGGVRATAAARLGWSEPQLTQKPDKPFSEWDTENICDWLQDLGLDQYIPEARKWVKNGQQLQECAIAEIEKELNIKNPLHKKKLQLALIDAEENGSSDPYLRKAGELDTAWVLRWLDDVGLPQHKESFLINRVDGRVLHRLTVDDLGVLHVTSLLHVASIKRGIQVLRENDYSAACLKRRSAPDEGAPTPKLVSLWTTHRVMEWLRAVDLAEYAPNLRGAGVHGGLMVHETKFTADLLASLLSIPPGKTLLRRHLNTHFKELLGRDIIQEKREAQSTMGYIPLTPTAKLKTTKKSQFSLKRKKSKGEADYGDLVCPLNPEKQSDEDDKPRGRGCLSSR